MPIVLLQAYTSIISSAVTPHCVVVVVCWCRSHGIKVFDLDKILIPINIDNVHWCLAVVEVQALRISIIDR